MEKINLEIVRLNIQLTKRCNQRCKSCNSYQIDDTVSELSIEEIEKFINEACSIFPIKNIAFTGGEPTLYKDILSVAKIASKKSPFVSITTNGIYCTSKERVNELLDSGINRFSFSYHGIGIHDEFCGVNGSEERIRRAIDWLVKERERGKDVYIKIGSLLLPGGGMVSWKKC